MVQYTTEQIGVVPERNDHITRSGNTFNCTNQKENEDQLLN